MEGAVALSQTNFLGVTIDTVNGPTNRKIKKALYRSFTLLNILDFIQVTKFSLNMVMFDYFWQVVVGSTRMLLDTRVLEWFGYDGNNRNQRQNFKKMLKNNGINFYELTQRDEELNQFPTIKEELRLIPSNVKNSKFLIMEPDDLKMAIMQLKTKNGHKIRQYYIDLEKLLKMYVEYTLYFNHRQANRKISTLEQMMADLKLSNQRQEEYMRSMGIQLDNVRDQNEVLLDQNEDLLSETKGLKKQNNKIHRKLGIAVEDRAPLPENKDKQDRFVVLKRNDPKHAPFYSIRGQHQYVSRRTKQFANAKIILDFEANPNAFSLFIRIKEELIKKGVLFCGNNIMLGDSTLSEKNLIDAMKAINDEKYEV
jgi:hypothetical protein